MDPNVQELHSAFSLRHSPPRCARHNSPDFPSFGPRALQISSSRWAGGCVKPDFVVMLWYSTTVRTYMLRPR